MWRVHSSLWLRTSGKMVVKHYYRRLVGATFKTAFNTCVPRTHSSRQIGELARARRSKESQLNYPHSLVTFSLAGLDGRRGHLLLVMCSARFLLVAQETTRTNSWSPTACTRIYFKVGTRAIFSCFKLQSLEGSAISDVRFTISAHVPGPRSPCRLL